MRELRKFNPSLPVIVISGLAEAEDEYKGLDVIFRTKPCDPEDLISLLQCDFAPVRANRVTA